MRKSLGCGVCLGRRICNSLPCENRLLHSLLVLRTTGHVRQTSTSLFLLPTMAGVAVFVKSVKHCSVLVKQSCHPAAGVVQQENYGGVMGAAMPPSHLDNDFFKQLTQLVDFRERGLLSEVEFDEAKQRLMISSRDV
eukprot:TRINITY_DN9153_c1_g2_i2.p1 TRINITY_DN9153_c1_g2~~TRINITY_DN9153_c1_g2_i2.p1  ORF type:complete len:137 (+),score=5.14 TRINITY_DN9153_c1_g2_i2:223-633(+)